MIRTARNFSVKKIPRIPSYRHGQINCHDHCFRLSPKFNFYRTETRTKEVPTILLCHSKTADLHWENSDGAKINAIQTAIRRSIGRGLKLHKKLLEFLSIPS